MRGTPRLGLLWALSLRSLVSHWVKSLIVGAILAFGTFLVVLGTALIDSIEKAMADSITGSLAGQLQLYSEKAKDELALYGGGFMGSEDIGRIDDFSKLKEQLAPVPGIAAIVPMGIDMATTSSPGELERALAAMRKAVRDGDEAPRAALQSQIREILGQMSIERERRAVIAADKDKNAEAHRLLDRARSDAFWSDFATRPLDVLEELDTKVAPLAEEGRMIYFRYVGTDLDLFQKHFDRFQIIDGQMVPPKQRGFLINKQFYEEWVKNFVAKNLDLVARGKREKSQTIEKEPTLQALVRQTARQYRRITYQLDPEESQKVEAALKGFLPEVQGGLPELLQSFLSVDDANFEERYAFFYKEIAPYIDLYDIDVGDTMSITAYTRSGFLKSVNVKVYGTFSFKGLDKSDLAGSHSLMDLLTFRELYGLMSDEKKSELAAIKSQVGVKDVSADSAESELFGADEAAPAAAPNTAKGFDEFSGVDFTSERERMKALENASFGQDEVDHGLALNAAVVLSNPKEDLKAAKARVTKALEGGGLGLKVVDWQAASGVVGQFILVIRGVLYIAIFIIFTVAMVIINNSMVMATMERVTEIGTMRAIGAQRTMVLAMFLVETVVLGSLAGFMGAAIAGGLVSMLGTVGLAAPTPEMVFLFGGPRLYPTLALSNLVIGAVLILLVSLISTLYPAYLAAQIQPVVAMQPKE